MDDEGLRDVLDAGRQQLASEKADEDMGLFTPYEQWLFFGPFKDRSFRLGDLEVLEGTWNAALDYVRAALLGGRGGETEG